MATPTIPVRAPTSRLGAPGGSFVTLELERGPRVVRLILTRLQPMMAMFVLFGAVLVGALYWIFLKALLDVGLAAVATTICVAVIASFGVMMVLGVMG